MGKVALGGLAYTALHDAVCLSLRKAIVEGKLKPGERLLEVELARELGTSRAPIREAIRQLESEGLVVSARHRGTFVTMLSARDAREIFGLRAALEGMAVNLLVRSGKPDALEPLERLRPELLEAREDDSRGVIESDLRFHEALCRGAGNTRLLDAWLCARTQIRAFFSDRHLLYLTPRGILRRHDELLAAMRELDPARAMRLLIDDLVEAGEHAAARLAREAGEGDQPGPYTILALEEDVDVNATQV